jgi:hypothetical protein
MLGAFKRWIGGKPEGLDGHAILSWAKQHELVGKRVRDEQGVVVEGTLNSLPWRLEWGTPQRAYLLDRELRVRLEMGLPSSLQMLITSRSLAEELEQAAFSLFTQDMQTQVDSGMPEEMRWLAMFPKIQLAAMKTLRARFAATGSNAPSLAAWLDEELVARLDEAGRTWLVEDQPFLMMTLRGRLYVRLECAQPDDFVLDGIMSLVTAAARSAVAVADTSASGQNWPSTSSTAWQNHLD